MKKFLLQFLALSALTLMNACGNKPDSQDQKADLSKWRPKNEVSYKDVKTSDNSSSSNGSSVSAHSAMPESEQALKAAQSVITYEFALDARFHRDGTIIEPTGVPGRYKIIQEFESEKYDDRHLVYRIWIQKFGDDWEYGNLGVESRVTKKTLLTKNGKMKERERAATYKTESSSVGNINYTVVKQLKPNYVIIFTPTKLKKADLKKLYNHFKNDYESIRFTVNKDPDKKDYFCIQYGMVFDYDKDKITKLAEW